jgi:metal-dependent amidase/aminoacylase/carboxypeptidase family protein
VFDPVVLTVGTFQAGTTDNVIPDDARFVATIRTFSGPARDRARSASVDLVRQLAAAHGLAAGAEFVDGYPLTVNDAAEAGFAADTVRELLGSERFVTAPNPLTTAEDFSYVLEQVPVAFLFLGACPPGADPATAPYNHSAEAMFDDGVLTDGVALYAALALRRLAAASIRGDGAG